MKQLGFLLGVLALAACGLITTPPIPNPFGLEGTQTPVNLGPSSAAVGNLNATANFDDLTNLSIPVTPSGFTYNLAISGVSLSGNNCPSPSTVTVTLSLSLTVSDNPSSGPRQVSANASNVQFTLTQSSSGYTVGSISNGTISISSSNVSTLVNILQNGGQNTATLTGTVTTTSNPDLAGCTMTITWGGGQGTLTF